MKKILITVLFVLVVTPSFASTRLAKLSENRYLITHQKQTALGGQGKALRLSYEKAASLCVILDYSWFEIKQMESKGRTWGSGAASTLEVKFHHEQNMEDENDYLDCRQMATEEQKQKMRKALQRAKQR